MARRQRGWIGIVALWGVTTIGCATGGLADPDAEAIFDDVEKPTDDTGEKPTDDTGEGDDAVVGDDVGSELDAGTADAGGDDTGTMDAGVTDTGPMDTGPVDTGVIDTGPMDTGPMDTGPVDTGPRDTGPIDTGPIDTGPIDTGPVDTGVVDTGPTVPTIECRGVLGAPRTCRGDGTFPPCCIIIAILPATCGTSVPLLGCVPN